MLPLDETLLGQERVAASFLAALRKGTLSHVMILLGPEGSGKSTLADFFARALLCTGTTPPCGVCGSCIRAQTGNHPDLHIFTPARPGAFRVADAETLQKVLLVRPYEGGRRVLIVPDAQRMTEEAQNKLLKVLEEPPADTYIFLLATSLAPFLPTVLSRCVQINLDRMETERLLSHLREAFHDASDGRLRHAAASAQGWPLRAKALLEDESYWETREQTLDFLVNARTLRGKMELFRFYAKRKDELLASLDLWEWMLRDAAFSGEDVTPIHADQSARIHELKKSLTKDQLMTLWRATQEARAALAQNAAVSMTLDAWLAAWPHEEEYDHSNRRAL